MKSEIIASVDFDDFLVAVEDACGEGSYQHLAEWILEEHDIFVEGLHLETVRELARIFQNFSKEEDKNVQN